MAFNQTSKMRSELAGMAPGKPLLGGVLVAVPKILSLSDSRKKDRGKKAMEAYWLP